MYKRQAQANSSSVRTAQPTDSSGRDDDRICSALEQLTAAAEDRRNDNDICNALADIHYAIDQTDNSVAVEGFAEAIRESVQELTAAVEESSRVRLAPNAIEEATQLVWDGAEFDMTLADRVTVARELANEGMARVYLAAPLCARAHLIGGWIDKARK